MLPDLAVIVLALLLVAFAYQDRLQIRRDLEGERHRSDELLDRFMARSLVEYKAVEEAHPDVPEYREPDLAGRWVHDATGLHSVFVTEGED